MAQQKQTVSASAEGGTASLHRTLGLWNLIIIGLVIIQPTAPMGIYGVISNKANGHVVTSILIAMVAMLLTAISYGRMARVYPSAGSAYTYVGQEIHSAFGYVVGWGMVMDYLLNPLICTAFCAKAAMNILPGLSYYVWIVIFAAFFTWVNLRGVKTSARMNEALCAGMVIVVAIFLVSVVRTVWHMQHDPGFFTRPFYDPQSFHPSSIFAGTSVAVLTYIGFDAVSTLSEEAENPRRNILLATVLVCLITGLLSGVEVYAAQLIWGSKPFPSNQVESSFALIARQAGGALLFQIINFTLLVANMGSGMGSQLAAGRLLYGMGRGNALPKSFFGAIEPKRRIPRNNIVAVGLFAFAGAGILEFFSSRLGGGAYEIGAEALNFGAFIAFMGVNAAAFVHYWLHGRNRNLSHLFVPVLGFVICGFIWVHLSRPALVLGALWMVAGITYGAIRTRGFRSELVTFEVPPEEA
ncbi:APC family permease [Alloacidobacterium dinghuense]|uniref:APC family permease n=1 Tax=Alloacidobacterium dinghuense TaxID=2763107 RepID=A0A7G8BMI7_9BACT|nr:APC family permease [Alloacidobacterium dinghuense]QNI33757.1 APC family permease [Alloacidobacterium dinghuense]